MRRLLLTLCIALPLLLGCGDDEEETTVTGTETVTEATTGTGTATEAATPTGEGPRGELSRRGIGSVEVGMTTGEVEKAFGAPDLERQVTGCPLAGPDAPPILQWTWNLQDGSAVLDFEVAGRALISYRTTSTALPTTAGVRVGDSFKTLRQSYGGTLKGLPLGAKPTETVGFWYVGKPAKLWQLFDLRGGKIKNIQGGDVQICE